MSQPGNVPERVEYRRYATRGRIVEGSLPLAAMTRLGDAVHRPPQADALVRVRLAFSEDDQRRVRVTGRLAAPVTLQCQRCFAAFVYNIDTPVDVVVVADDEAAASVPHADEPVIAEGDMLALHALPEDEWRLALPCVGRCEDPVCRAGHARGARVAAAGAEGRAQRRRQDNPFAVLKDLKRDAEPD